MSAVPRLLDGGWPSSRGRRMACAAGQRGAAAESGRRRRTHRRPVRPKTRTLSRAHATLEHALTRTPGRVSVRMRRDDCGPGGFYSRRDASDRVY